MRHPHRVPCLAAAAALAACVAPGAQDAAVSDPEPMEPTFAPLSGPAATPTPGLAVSPSPAVVPEPRSSPDPTASPPTAASAPRGSTPAAIAPAISRVEDAPDDRTRTLQPSPDWADLAAGELRRDAGRFTLRIELTGGAPQAAPDADHTMNIASFYDVDGDGRIDYEVWANLAAHGWGTSWFDNRAGRSAFGDDDQVDVQVVDSVLVLRFPAELLGGARTFRWSLASEYGRYEHLGTTLTARDDAPDDNRPAPFPDPD